MKLTFIATICVLILSSCSKDNIAPTNQLPLENADMESGTTQPSFWISNPGTPEITTTWSSDRSSSASHSLEIARANVSDTNYGYWRGLIQGIIPTGKNLNFSIKIKGDNLVGEGIAIAVRVDGTNSTGLQFSTTQNKQLITGTFDWKSYSIKLADVTNQAQYVYLFLIYGPNTTGKVYFDDASLTYN